MKKKSIDSSLLKTEREMINLLEKIDCLLYVALNSIFSKNEKKHIPKKRCIIKVKFKGYHGFPSLCFSQAEFHKISCKLLQGCLKFIYHTDLIYLVLCTNYEFRDY